MSSVFPLELVDIVLDFLHDDRRVLGRISLVSSTWAISARHHLFYRLEIKNLSELYDFILKDGRLHLTPYVQILAIKPSRTESMTSFPLDQLVSLIGGFPNLQQLDMPSVRIRHTPIVHSHIPTLKTLHISYNWIGNQEIVGDAKEVQSLWRVLSLFSRVENLHLCLTKSILDNNPPESPSYLTPRSSVDNLILDDRISGSITRLLQATIDLPNVRTLSVVSPLQIYIPPLAQFLRLVPQVRDLTIHLPAKGSPNNPEPEWKLLQLDTTLPLLSSFTLQFAPDGWANDDRIFIPVLILSTAREIPCLKVINIEPILSQRVWLNKSTSALTDIDWAHAAHYLSQFKELRMITIRVRYRSQMSTYRTRVVKIPPHIKDLIQKGFSALPSRVQLVISDV